MYPTAQKLFYGLAIFVCLNVLFVLQTNYVVLAPNTQAQEQPTCISSLSLGQSVNLEVAFFRYDVLTQSNRGFWQVMGDKSMFDDLAIVWSGLNDFYNSAQQQMITLLSPIRTQEDVFYIYTQVYSRFVNTLSILKGEDNGLAYSNDTQEGVIAGEKIYYDLHQPIPSTYSDQDLFTGEFMTEEPLYEIVPTLKNYRR